MNREYSGEKLKNISKVETATSQVSHLAYLTLLKEFSMLQIAK